MKTIPGWICSVAALALPAAAALADDLTPRQIEAAAKVYAGDAECEFKQTVRLLPVAGQPGHFELTFKKLSYRLVPEETSTGAVRLEDRAAGIVWIQIPSKSMLLNAKLGQRMVDGCVNAAQRAAVTVPTNNFGLAELQK